MKYLFILFIPVLFVSCKKKSEHEPVQGLQEITSLNQLNNDISAGVSLVFYHASWCTICQGQRPAVTDVAEDSELSGVYFGEVEYDDYPEILDDYNIDGFPTIVIYKNGNEVDRFNGGGHSKQTLKSAIQNHL